MSSSPSAVAPAASPSPALPRARQIDRRFANPGHHDNRTFFDILRWKFGGSAAPWPKNVPVTPHSAPPAPIRGLTATWVGHATFLLRTPTLSLVTDPHWSEHAGPFGLGPRRVHAPGITLETLPPLDAILLSHDHYDHCDLVTLRRLARMHSRARLVAPLGFDDLAVRAGFAGRFATLDWWQSVELAPGHRLTATPARHWSNRLSGGRNQRLWCGWYLTTPEAALFFAGDTGPDPDMFTAIQRTLGAPDLALLPVGAYAPRWFMRGQHCDPAEAVGIHQQLGVHRSVGMHWGTFHLTDEPRDEPPAKLAEAVREAGLPPDAFITVSPGDTVATPPP